MTKPPIPYSDRRFQALLFDMDGTLLTSIESAERVWSRWLTRHGLDPLDILPTIHGVQTLETIRRLGIPGIDPRQEADWIAREELADLEGVRAIEGAAEFVAGLPHDGWAIVTSATRTLAEARLAAAGLVPPPLFITAEDIANGKPAPDCYIEAARRLDVDVTQCLVFEDAPAGIASGRAAGADVVVITATHTHPLATDYPSIRDYRGLTTAHSEGMAMLRAGTAR
ncbi:HAD-IA family hydrolase [Sphingomonas sp. H39-1-10]|uniref:HAD-IA family hydrolase n=1 Tax=Sphingomonas pollutisoli TaxID=3030829 RepID=UPI0023B8E1DB|nr:HAD-IA family hydrolase [Sphingomonas pollutisoli]MDF0486688.1 HAD-IA family hydrolase [Sphingomonas pollutisoli]